MSISIPEPVLHYAFALASEGTGPKFGEWREAGQFWIWFASLLPEDQPLVVLEMTNKGVIEFKQQGYLMHLIPARQPHHINHLFGYWQVSDADRIWIQMPRPDAFLYSMIWSAKSDFHKQDRIQWFCPKCGNLLADRLIELAVPGLEGFEQGQLEAVRQFNSDRELRTCRNCEFVHPEAYGFYPLNDTPMEQSARRQW